MNSRVPFFIFFALVFASTLKASDSYDLITQLLRQRPGVLRECQCLSGIARDIEHLDTSLRAELDREAAKVLASFANKKDRPTLFFFGSGKLLNEATVLASIMSHKISPRIVLIDQAYDFTSSTEVGNIKLFEDALEHFKVIMDSLSKKYGVQADIRVFFDLQEAFSLISESGERMTAFFMIDSFYPTSKGLEFLNSELKKNIESSSNLDFCFDSFLFFLNKKDEGHIRLPILNQEEGSITGLDWAVLEIYQACFKGGVVESKNQLFGSVL